jgi:hypothetical protein
MVSRARLLLFAITNSALAGVNAWTTNGPEGGPVASIAVDPNNSSILYAATIGQRVPFYPHGGGGMFKSIDHGLTWTPINSGLPAREITAVIATRQFLFGPTVLFCTPWGAGVYRSTNGGTNWVAVNNGLNFSIGITALALDAGSFATVYAAGFGGVFVTHNFGTTWTNANSGLAGTPVGVSMTGHPIVPNVAFVSTLGAGVFATVNGGSNWTQFNCGLPNANAAFVNSVAVSRVFPWPMFAATPQGLYERSIFLPCWTKVGGLPPGGYGVVVTDPYATQNTYVASSQAVFANTGTAAWTQLGANFNGTNVLTMTADPLAASPLVGTSGDGLMMLAGGAWSQRNAGLTAHNAEAVAIAPGNAQIVYAATVDDGVFKSLNGGLTWQQVLAPIPFGATYAVAIDPTNANVVYTGRGPIPMKSTNGGATWTPIANGAVAPGAFITSITAIAIDPTNTSVVYLGTDAGVFKTTNGGASWSLIYGGYTGFMPTRSIAIDPTVSTTIYAGFPGNLIKSTDGGLTWNNSTSGMAGTAVTSIAIRPDHTNIVYAATEDGGVFRSDTAGAFWSSINVGLGTNPIVSSVVIDPSHFERLYAGMRGGGVFVSTNTGATWSAFHAGDLNPFVNGIAIAPNGGSLHAATGGSVYDFSFPGGSPNN